MGPPKSPGASLYAILHQIRSSTLQPPHPHQTSVLTFPTHTPPNYGAKVQYTKYPDTTEIINDKGKKFTQQVSGNLLYLARDVDITLLTPMSSIASQQSKLTATTMKRTLQILDCVDTQKEAVLTYSRRKMTLSTHSDAGYLNKPEACSRAGGIFLVKQHNIPTKQWRHTHHCTNH